MVEEQDVVGFATRNRRAFLFCHDASGHPIGYPMSVFFADAGSILFSTYAKSAKVAHIERDPRVSCVVMSEATESSEVAWTTVHCSAELVRPTAREVDDILARRRPDARISDSVREKTRARLIEGKRLLIRLPLSDGTVATRA